MVYGGACSNSNTILLQNQRVSCSDPLDSIFLSGSSPSFLGNNLSLPQFFADLFTIQSIARIICAYVGVIG
ncbi:hypothetical protein ACR2V0_28900, partial [Klebsiella pneumoniae]